MATEQTITISGTPTVVSGVTVPYVETSDLEIYVGKGKIESIEVVDKGAGYTNRARDAAEKLIFSGGDGTAPDLWITVGQDANNSGRIDGSIYGHATSGAALVNTNLNVGSGYTTSPNISLTNLDGGEGGQLTAKIYAIKTAVTDYSISGTSGNATITFTSALSDGDKVLVKRVTGVSTAANTFTTGSAITATDLNKSFDQIRHRVEELPEVTSTALTNGNKGDITVSGNNWTINTTAVEQGMLGGDCINGDKIEDNAIGHEHIKTDAVRTAEIQDDAVTYPKIQNITTANRVLGRASAGEVQEVQVATDMIADLAATQAKIDNQAINEAKLQISNGPTNGYVLTAESGNTGGLTWAVAPTLAGSILETVSYIADGTEFTQRGVTYNLDSEKVTAAQQLTLTHAKIAGSEISYTPPTGTKTVIYEFRFTDAREGSAGTLWHGSLWLAGTEVTHSRTSKYAQGGTMTVMKWAFPINASLSADTNTGRVTSWTSAKTIMMKAREYTDSGYAVKFHQTSYWDGLDSDQLSLPTVTVTALS